MKKRIDAYSFDASAKTVTFTDYTTIKLEAILHVQNAKDGIVIYSPFDTAKLGTVATNVLTCAFDTTGMEDTDPLTIFYDDVPDDPQVKVIEITAANATDATLLTVASGKKAVLHQCEVFRDNACTVDVEVKMALGATGATANFAWHPGIGGEGFIKPLHDIKGTNGQDVVYQNTVPTDGSITMGLNYSLVDA